MCTHILKLFEDSEPTGLKVDIAKLPASWVVPLRHMSCQCSLLSSRFTPPPPSTHYPSIPPSVKANTFCQIACTLGSTCQTASALGTSLLLRCMSCWYSLCYPLDLTPSTHTPSLPQPNKQSQHLAYCQIACTLGGTAEMYVMLALSLLSSEFSIYTPPPTHATPTLPLTIPPSLPQSVKANTSCQIACTLGSTVEMYVMLALSLLSSGFTPPPPPPPTPPVKGDKADALPPVKLPAPWVVPLRRATINSGTAIWATTGIRTIGRPAPAPRTPRVPCVVSGRGNIACRHQVKSSLGFWRLSIWGSWPRSERRKQNFRKLQALHGVATKLWVHSRFEEFWTEAHVAGWGLSGKKGRATQLLANDKNY